ncbi:MAG: hypothetical protein HYX60_11500 [Legionella longbeachae]|nr:hypothetical protein [Legionella longbeachae]
MKNLGSSETDEINFQYELFNYMIYGGNIPAEQFNVNRKEGLKNFLTGGLGQLAINIVSQEKTSNLKLSHYPNTYPFVCYQILDKLNVSKNQILTKKMQVFFDKIIKVNNRVKKEDQANITLFIFEHQIQIMQTINIMGVSGIDYLSSFLAETTLSLARTLSLIPSFNNEEQLLLAEYFKHHDLNFEKNSEQVITFIHCMIAIKNLMLGNTKISDILTKENINLAPKDLLLNLNKQMIHLLLGGGEEEETKKTSEENILKMCERIRPERLAQLISAGIHMDSNEYQKIYFNLLKIDLLGNGFDTFLHDDIQEDELGKQLASHNIKINNKLKEFGISPENALSYKKQLEFKFKPVSKEKKSIGSDTVGLSYIQELCNNISEISLNEEQHSSVIKDLQKIQEYAKQLLTRFKDSDLSLKKPHNLIQNILSLLKKIKSENNNISTGFNEFSQHVLDHFKNITSKMNTTQKGSNKSYDFLIEQWPKSHVDTFFLGDEVGCCLATTNSQFHAMVQRRMDDAMLFHVAIDQRTKKPVALIWLYLAETKDNQIVLIANFFEVNTKYALDESLRLALLNGLLQFTEQYCKDNPKIAGFYMNQLSYGWNKNDLNSHNLINYS